MTKKFVPNNNDFAIAYYRFSSHAQSDASIQQQRDAAQKYAAGHGLQIVKEYKDEAISGTTDQRPGFQLMLTVCLLSSPRRYSRRRKSGWY